MKLDLIESLDRRGIFTKCKPFISDKLEIEVGCEGVLVLSTTTPTGAGIQKGFNAVNGIIKINDYELLQGISHATFTRSDGVIFDCGEIHRNSRFIHTKSSAEELIISLAIAHFEQEKKIEELSDKLVDLASRYGITII